MKRCTGLWKDVVATKRYQICGQNLAVEGGTTGRAVQFVWVGIPTFDLGKTLYEPIISCKLRGSTEDLLRPEPTWASAPFDP